MEKIQSMKKSIIDELIPNINNWVDNHKNNTSFIGNFISDIPSTGLIINTSGTYTFTNDINWNGNINTYAISILANDVVLNMNGFNLNCINDNVGTVGIGIFLVKNVIVKNGSINNMNIQGLVLYFGTQINLEKLYVNGMTNTNKLMQPSGIFMFSSNDVIINDVKIKNINSYGLAVVGILLLECKNFKITNVYINNLSNQAGVCSGISYIESSDIYVKNACIKNLYTGLIDNSLAPGHTCIGMLPFSSQNLKFINCKVKNIHGSCDDAHGISLFVVTNAIVDKCYIKNVTDGHGGKGAKTTGIEVYGTRDENAKIVIKNCNVENIYALNPGNLQAAAYSVAGDNIKFERCVAKNVKVKNTNNTANIGKGYGVGFGWAPDIRDVYIYPAINILYEKCTAENCQIGFDTFNHQNSKWCDLSFCHNDINILKHAPSIKKFYCDSCSECPDGPKFVEVTNDSFGNKFHC